MLWLPPWPSLAHGRCCATSSMGKRLAHGGANLG
jgi:hypothetical protein